MENTPRDTTPLPNPPEPPITPVGPEVNRLSDPTPGTKQVPAIKKLLPRLIICALLINFIPSAFGIFGESYRETGETIRNYANIAFIIVFLIIVTKQITERK